MILSMSNKSLFNFPSCRPPGKNSLQSASSIVVRCESSVYYISCMIALSSPILGLTFFTANMKPCSPNLTLLSSFALNDVVRSGSSRTISLEVRIKTKASVNVIQIRLIAAPMSVL